jgi:lipopolysaccharide biosynthesis glycosyltransferase
MVIIGKLSSIFEIDLENYPLGAVYDNYVKVQPEIGITEEGKYFNSGMLYYNLPLWRAQCISEKAVKYLSAYPERIKFVDQCALNAVIDGNWKVLNEKFNLLFSYVPKEISKKELLAFATDKVVIHYTLQRPWNLFCQNRLRVFYFKYYRLSKNLNGNPITDFSILNLKKWIKMRLIELYFDFGVFNVAWRGMKKAVKLIK